MTTSNKVQIRAEFDKVAQEIDRIAEQSVGLFSEGGGFLKEVEMARAMNDMRDLLTPDIMAPIMALMNTDLGFRTDRDPKNNDKTGKPFVPYGFEVVRETFIESRLRGFHSVGNEWNIIAGRFYGCLNGFRRKVLSYPGVSKFQDWFSVPAPDAKGNSVVKARASWVLNGVEDGVERDIPIRVNQYMGDDAVLGKARRKLYKEIWDRVSGTNTPEGDANEAVPLIAPAAPVKARASTLVEAPKKENVPTLQPGDNQGDLLG